MSRTIRTLLPSPRPAGLPRRAALASLLLLPLAACSTGSGTADDPADDTAETAETATSGDLTVTDPWVKAAEEGMTAAFGTLTNATDTDLVLVAATTPATDMVELHETTADGSGGMSMREKEGGFPIAAGAELVLEPGGDHIMLMDLPQALLPGDEVELTLVFSDDSEVPFTATVKDYSGAQEHYAPGEESDGGGEHAGHGEGE